jgi:hypothetical protein
VDLGANSETEENSGGDQRGETQLQCAPTRHGEKSRLLDVVGRGWSGVALTHVVSFVFDRCGL